MIRNSPYLRRPAFWFPGYAPKGDFFLEDKSLLISQHRSHFSQELWIRAEGDILANSSILFTRSSLSVIICFSWGNIRNCSSNTSSCSFMSVSCDTLKTQKKKQLLINITSISEDVKKLGTSCMVVRDGKWFLWKHSMFIPQKIKNRIAKLAQLIKVPGESELDPWDCSKGKKREPTA